ncbi:phosphoenolpyruvate--protein phosphotransferase [Brevibacillus sp. B_LB10_24]|uniref:phosphoenolpyruvate--protein phosphotransferase n=1 Tax=Brevibacillus sp. B_LB10_24 TaxID=3380645 RepID=UPI0038B72D31
MVKGIAASPGYAVGDVFLLEEAEMVIQEDKIKPELADAEWEKVKQAFAHTKSDLEKTKEDVAERVGEHESAIFASHIMILEDPTLSDEIENEIKTDNKNAVWATNHVFMGHAAIFAALDDDYMRERAADLKDIGNRVLKHLLGIHSSGLDDVTKPVILVANDLTPSQTARLDKQLIKGIITEIGGPTSHSAILARNLQIPAVVGCANLMQQLDQDSTIALDGFTGEVTLNPSSDLAEEYQNKQKAYLERMEFLRESASRLAETKDGKRIEVAANIGKPENVKAVLDNGGEGIGLFRSEFLFLERSTMPSEEEQYTAYAQVAKEMDGRPVIIRTLDIGGDKQVDYLPIGHELNPFLGFRAIRLCLAEKDLFKIQLRAILRASSYGKLRIMFPMIATEAELLEAMAVLDEAKAELRGQNIPFDEAIEVGIMIEIPSAALISDILAKHVDFFSIGSNDLIQYTFAADRMNEKVGYLYDPGHTAILRLIQLVVENAHREGKWVGVCGEMAGDPVFAKELIGVGVDELSMTATLIPQMKYEIAQLSYEELSKEAAAKLKR